MILLSLQGVQKSFGTNEVLRDASLTLQDGQLISDPEIITRGFRFWKISSIRNRGISSSMGT